MEWRRRKLLPKHFCRLLRKKFYYWAYTHTVSTAIQKWFSLRWVNYKTIYMRTMHYNIRYEIFDGMKTLITFQPIHYKIWQLFLGSFILFRVSRSIIHCFLPYFIHMHILFQGDASKHPTFYFVLRETTDHVYPPQII